jgi:LDH2 family malate/lactate/ureidoglycolate dehydrogenase
MPTVPHETMAALMTEIFRAAGASDANAETVARSLVLSDLVGHESHGVVRVRQYLNSIAAGDIRPAATPGVTRETAVMVAVDACKTFGQVAARFAMERAIDKARVEGLAVAGTYHCNHVGRLGEWVTLAAEAEMVGLAFCNLGRRGAAVAPHGGAGRLLGTNPVAAAVPVGGRPPLLVDFATSAVAEGKLRVARNRGLQIPTGWIVAADGSPTTDPNDFYNGGALLPFAGHKGYGLGMLAELLGGMLTDGGPERQSAASGHGTLFVVLNPAIFRPAEEFLADAAELCDRAVAIPPAAGFGEVLLPGDPEHRTAARRRAEGIPVDDTTWGQLAEAARSLGIPHETLDRDSR